MKKLSIIFCMSLIISSLSYGQNSPTIVKTIYQGKNMFVNNPMLDTIGINYCIENVLINNKDYNFSPKRTSVIALLLENLELEMGDSLTIKIVHKSDCTPIVVNPEVMEQLCFFEIVSSNLTNDILTFSTHNETKANLFYLEEYRMDRWREIGIIQGKGGNETNYRTYKTKVVPYSGTNFYRVYQNDFYGDKYYSETMKFVVPNRPIKINELDGNHIKFNMETTFSIIDIVGTELIHGTNDVVDITELKKGKYFACFENSYASFKKTKKNKIKMGKIAEFQTTDEVLNTVRYSDKLKEQHKK